MGDFAPGLMALGAQDFGFDAAGGLQEELADIGEKGGVAVRDAIQGDGGVELAQYRVDVGGGEVFAGGRSGQELANALGFKELAVFAGVVDAVGVMVGGTGHAAVAAVREGELAAAGTLSLLGPEGKKLRASRRRQLEFHGGS